MKDAARAKEKEKRRLEKQRARAEAAALQREREAESAPAAPSARREPSTERTEKSSGPNDGAGDASASEGDSGLPLTPESVKVPAPSVASGERVRPALGQTAAAGRKYPATRRAEATLAAAKQAWRRAETAQAQAKKVKEALESSPAGSGERARLTAEAAEAAEEARQAKAAWQDALAKAEASMQEAKKGREAEGGKVDG